MKKIIAMLAILLFTTAAFAQQRAEDAPIYKVLNSFMLSIIKKDTVTLTGLFAVNVPIGWIDVQGKQTFEASKKQNVNATIIETDTHKNFISFVGRTKKAVEEKFYNVRIRHDGGLASVSFDYSFWEDGKKANWGQENWELVFDGKDWKIAGVYFSYELESLNPEPAKVGNK